MKNNFIKKYKTIPDQVRSIYFKYPQFKAVFTSHDSMKVTGELQPTSRSSIYQFVLKYSLSKSPEIKIISPKLMKNEKGQNPPHLYPKENLCLYHPKYQEFKRTDLLGDTIIPWTSLWLYYYEVWHLTGDWLGGGEHPTKLKCKTK
jgi:hypothetical protein